MITNFRIFEEYHWENYTKVMYKKMKSEKISFGLIHNRYKRSFSYDKNTAEVYTVYDLLDSVQTVYNGDIIRVATDEEIRKCRTKTKQVLDCSL